MWIGMHIRTETAEATLSAEDFNRIENALRRVVECIASLNSEAVSLEFRQLKAHSSDNPLLLMKVSGGKHLLDLVDHHFLMGGFHRLVNKMELSVKHRLPWDGHLMQDLNPGKLVDRLSDRANLSR